jgi:hypothetical protein
MVRLSQTCAVHIAWISVGRGILRQRCHGLGIRGLPLHTYRYAWAKRVKVVGYPERFVQLALGHNGKAVHRAYARNAQVTLPPLKDYEKLMRETRIIPMPISAAG